MLVLQNSQEIKNQDSDGNVWKISLNKDENTSNRWKLSFFFNEKEFNLSKPQNNRAAETIWELIMHLKKSMKEVKEEKEIKKTDFKPTSKARPTKRTLKIKGD